MRLTFALAAVIALTACSTGVVQTDKDTYMVAEKAGGCGFATAGGQEAEAYKQANAFCSAKGLHVETVTVASQNGIPFARCANADLKFRCVP